MTPTHFLPLAFRVEPGKGQSVSLVYPGTAEPCEGVSTTATGYGAPALGPLHLHAIGLVGSLFAVRVLTLAWEGSKARWEAEDGPFLAPGKVVALDDYCPLLEPGDRVTLGLWNGYALPVAGILRLFVCGARFLEVPEARVDGCR